MTIKICGMCSDEFMVYRNSRFCSPECKTKSQKEHRKNFAKNSRTIKKIPKAISLNKFRNLHYFKINDLKNEFTSMVHYLLLEQKFNLRPLKTPIKTKFRFANYRNRDLDGEAICIKNFHDALTDLGLIPDDNRKYLKGFSVDELDEKGDYFEVDIIEMC